MFFIAKEGASLTWFTDTAKKELLSKAGRGKKPSAIVLMLGVNQGTVFQDYYTEYLSFAEEAKKSNCRLFVTTINPFNSAQIASLGGFTRKEHIIRARNEVFKSLPGFTLIDTRNYLLKTGYAYDSGKNAQSGKDDGIHYTTNTYLRIFRYVMTMVNRAQ